ncbi:MAG TPA: GAF domain-containing SpoIIE family protein phosphatase [Actinomycetota bacterium]|nr:GAF domain-containing SpoIIE family protein phosphatase [Actinomycetota bacterium]
MVSEIASPGDRADSRVEDLEQTLVSLRQDAEVAHVLLSLSAALAEVGPVEQTLERALRVATEILQAGRAFAATIAPGSDLLEIRSHVGFDRDSLDDLRRRAVSEGGLPIARRAISDGVPLVIPDVGAFEPEDDRGDRLPMGAFVGIPLSRWGEEFGLIGLVFDEPREFSTKDEALVQGLARQIGVAMTNARRFNLMGALRAFGLTLGTRLSTESALEQVIWGSASLLSGDSSAVYFLDAQDQSLVAAGSLQREQPNERFARIDLSSDPWAALKQGRTILFREKGSDPLTIVAAPIPGEGTPMLGAVAVFFNRTLTLGPDETEALSVLAGQAGMALENANRYERQRRVSRSLQAGLLSTDMPELEDIEIAAVYEPASGEADVGGDFFDVFPLGDERYGVVVGDVSGKGAEAAARTAMAKYMLRAFTVRDPDPASALYYLNNALTKDLEADRFATMVYGVFDARSRVWTIARGGHPPPLVFRSASGVVEAYEDIEGSILGAFPDMTFEETTFTLDAGDVILLYTDGLIEARADSGAFFGRKRIEEGLSRYGRDMSAADLTLQLYRDAEEFGTVGDDTVVFAMRCMR